MAPISELLPNSERFRPLTQAFFAALLRATGLSLVLVPLCYYSYVEIVRGTEISKRRKRYKRAAEAREAKRVAEGVWDEGKVGEKAEGKVEKVTEEELEEIKIAFASVSIGGRWSNPFPEWREQGAWEWMFWKLIWQPWCVFIWARGRGGANELRRTGRVMWDGGVPASAQELADSLPVEQPDFIKLFGRHPDDVADIVDLEAPASLSESWDHVSQPSTAVSEAPSRSNSHDNTVTVDQDLTFTWIGQSTSYVQLEGCGIITDPVFACVLPSLFAIPAHPSHRHKTIESFLAHPRLRPPPCPLSSLLSVQLALVSHNHFDHLHPLDVQHLGDSVQWIVPLGMAAFMRTLGVTRVIELDWWENTKVEVVVGGRTIRLEVHAVPAMHWSARSPLDTNQSLWCSFVVKGEKDSFFHWCVQFISVACEGS